MSDAFNGAKAAVFVGERLLVYRRDDRPDIPWPDHWDFPGGGREGAETPEETLFREIAEEFGLDPGPDSVLWKALHSPEGTQKGPVWFFVLGLPASAETEVVFGGEGQEWRLMAPEEFVSESRAVPHLARRLRDWLHRAGD